MFFTVIKTEASTHKYTNTFFFVLATEAEHLPFLFFSRIKEEIKVSLCLRLKTEMVMKQPIHYFLMFATHKIMGHFACMFAYQRNCMLTSSLLDRELNNLK